MGVKLRFCPDCREQKMIGRSKSRCKSCRHASHAEVEPDPPLPVEDQAVYAAMTEDEDPPLNDEKTAGWLLGRRLARSAEDSVREASEALGVPLEVKEVGPEGRQNFQWLFRTTTINLSFWPAKGSWQENRSGRKGLTASPRGILAVLEEFLRGDV